jgi:hypothetical protein
MRLRFVPLLLNYAAFALFIVFRPPSGLTPAVSHFVGASRYHGQSWVRAWLFLTLASLQWIGIGVMLERLRKANVS